MTQGKENRKHSMMIQYAPVFGIVLIVSGLLLLLDQRIKTTWLSISIPVVISLILLVTGVVIKKIGWIISGLITLGLSGFLFVMLLKTIPLDQDFRLAVGFAINAFAWLLIFGSFLLMRKRRAWWSLFITAICLGLAIVFFIQGKQLLDFILYISVPLGIVFLLWGITEKKLGLIIPGSLIATMATGVYMGWGNSQQPEGLQESGTMLVWFALGWMLIVVLSRVVTKRIVWWPLIPGGIMLMVGSGLYIGGNPGNTLDFLGNTGSIGLILFGIYLILLKFGMNNRD